MGITSSVLAVKTVVDPGRSFWSVVLPPRKEVNERSLVFDFRTCGFRTTDWSLDLVSTGDIYKIKKLSLYCPNSQIATLIIEEPGTAFQLKIGTVSVLSSARRAEAQIIGKVLDKEKGDCFCYIWDNSEHCLVKFVSNVFAFGSWRDGILPLGKLSHDVLGLRL